MKILTIILTLFISCLTLAQSFSDADDKDKFLLNKLVGKKVFNKIRNEYEAGRKAEALDSVAEYFAEKMSERYFFNWKNVDERYAKYIRTFPGKLKHHEKRAREMTELYVPDNDWNLPMKAKSGRELSSYEFRHLSRQHKAVDLAFEALHDKPELINYVMQKVNSLEKAYVNDSFERKGNGVFESFRAGHRAFNWLLVYNLLQGEENFSNADKFSLIKSFYYHGYELRKATKKFRYGNHQTRGLQALAVISILYSEFKESDEWYNHAVKLLTEHLQKEINPDGFQFERSVHYHIGDIDNYFYVLYLAGINNKPVPEEFRYMVFKMFKALTLIAYPNKTLPVLQDDTDHPFAEYNNMKSVMALGAALFKNKEFRYFSADRIPADKFWFLRKDDAENLNRLKGKRPQFLSAELPETGYYIMRNGWYKQHTAMIISAGLSEHKPDHQHGDMLGLQLYAFENYMLPNYQIRYYRPEFPEFKNSLRKNVCTVDSIPHGRNWKGNRGGTGFGKWQKFPETEALKFYTSDNVDIFIGSNNYEDAEHKRKVIFIKDGFYIVKDYLSSDRERNYQQIWQGIYGKETQNLYRSTFANGAGLDIYQLNGYKRTSQAEVVAGKGTIIFHKENCKKAEFITLLYPFTGFEGRLDERKDLEEEYLLGWNYTTNVYESPIGKLEADHIFHRDKEVILINLKKINEWNVETDEVDLQINNEQNNVQFFNRGKIKLTKDQQTTKISGFEYYDFKEFLNE